MSTAAHAQVGDWVTLQWLPATQTLELHRATAETAGASRFRPVGAGPGYDLACTRIFRRYGLDVRAYTGTYPLSVVAAGVAFCLRDRQVRE